MRIQDEFIFEIEPGHTVTEYATDLMYQLEDTYRHLAGEENEATQIAARKTLQTMLAVKFMLAVFPEREHENRFRQLCESFEEGAQEVWEELGRDWNPHYEELQYGEPRLVSHAFVVTAARDFRVILDQIELDRLAKDSE